MEVDKKATEVNFVRPRHERERDSALAVATLRQITVIQGILRRRAISFEVASRDLLRGKCVIAERRRRHRPIFTRCRSNLRRHTTRVCLPFSACGPSKVFLPFRHRCTLACQSQSSLLLVSASDEWSPATLSTHSAHQCYARRAREQKQSRYVKVALAMSALSIELIAACPDEPSIYLCQTLSSRGRGANHIVALTFGRP